MGARWSRQEGLSVASAHDTARDEELIERARAVIRRNYDGEKKKHTVGAAVRCASGNVYVGVNVHALHGVCAEGVAIGAAITAGEREFECVACVRGPDGEEILPPCGNCRQILNDYTPDCLVVVPTVDGWTKVRVADLLPFSYKVKQVPDTSCDVTP
jgi:cytidine deaminase